MSTIRHKVLIVSSLAGIAVALGLALVSGSELAPAQDAELSDARIQATSYEVEYEVLQWDSRLGTSEPATLSFAGALTIAGEGTERVVSLDRIDRLEVSIGALAEVDLEALRGARALLVLAPDGSLHSVAPEGVVSAEAEHLLRSLAQELSAPSRADARVEVQSPRGTAVDRVARRSSAGGYVIETERLGYSEGMGLSPQASVRVTGQRELSYAEGHQITRARVREVLDVRDEALELHVEVSLDLRGSAPHRVAAVELSSDAVDRERQQLEDHRLRMLRARAEGLSVAALADAIAGAGESGRIADHATFAWRATALLALDPEACAAIAEICLDPATPQGARLLVIDLLAQADGEAAQGALRRVLLDPSIRGSAGEAELLGHLILVQRADAELVALLGERAAAPEPEVQRAAAYALGSALHIADRESAEAQAGHATLVASLDAALAADSDDAALSSSLDALGNAGWEADADAIARASRGRSVEVRTAATRALRRAHTREARTHLGRMLDDDAPEVRREAMRSLADGGLDDSGFAQLARAAGREDLATDEVGTLVDLASSSAQTHPEQTEALLAALLSHRIESRPLRIQAEGLAAMLAHGG